MPLVKEHVIALVDCDCFFVSCERVDNLGLNGKTVCVPTGATSKGALGKSMGPSWCIFICGAASRAIFLAKQKKSGWSGVFRKYLNIKYLYNFQKSGAGHF